MSPPVLRVRPDSPPAIPPAEPERAQGARPTSGTKQPAPAVVPPAAQPSQKPAPAGPGGAKAPVVDERQNGAPPKAPPAPTPAPANPASGSFTGVTGFSAPSSMTNDQAVRELWSAAQAGDSRRMVQVFYGRSKETQQQIISGFNQFSARQGHGIERGKDALLAVLNGSNLGEAARYTAGAIGAHDFDYYVARMPEGDRFQLQATMRNPSGRMEDADRLRWAYSSGTSSISLVNRARTDGEVVLDQYRGKSPEQITEMENDYRRVYGDDPTARAESALSPSERVEWRALRSGSEHKPEVQSALDFYRNGRGAWISDSSAMFGALEQNAGTMGAIDTAYRTITDGKGLAQDLVDQTNGPLSQIGRAWRGSEADWQGRITSLVQGKPDAYLAHTARLFAQGQIDWDEARRAIRTMGQQGVTLEQTQAAYAQMGGKGSVRDLIANAASGDRRVAADLNLWAPQSQAGAAAAGVAPVAERETRVLATDLATRISDRRSNNDDSIESFLRDVPADKRASLEETFKKETGKTVEEALRERSIAGFEEVQAQASGLGGGFAFGGPAAEVIPYDKARIAAMMQTLRGTRTAGDELADVARGFGVSEQFAGALSRTTPEGLDALRSQYEAAAKAHGTNVTFEQALEKLPTSTRDLAELQLKARDMMRSGNFDKAAEALKGIIGNERDLSGSLWTRVQANFADATGFRGVPLDDSMRAFMSDAAALRARVDRGETLGEADRARMRENAQRVMHNYTKYLEEKGANAETAAMVAATVATLGYGAIASGASLAGRAALFGLVSATTQKGLDANTTPEQMARTFATGAAFEVGGEVVIAPVVGKAVRGVKSQVARLRAVRGAAGDVSAPVSTSGTGSVRPPSHTEVPQPRPVAQEPAELPELPRGEHPRVQRADSPVERHAAPPSRTQHPESSAPPAEVRPAEPEVFDPAPAQTPEPVGAGAAPAPAVVAPAIPEQNLADLTLSRRLNMGGNSNVYEIAGQPDRVAIINAAVDARDVGRSQLAKLTPAARAQAAAAIREDVEYTARVSGLTFEGQPIAPRIYNYVRDADGHVIGYVTERVPGRELQDLASHGALSDAQMKEVERQLRGQMEVAHKAGLVHGDPHTGNVLVDTGPPLRSRFIDWTPPGSSWTPKDDAGLFEERTIQQMYEEASPEAVQRTLAGDARRAERAATREATRRLDAVRPQLDTGTRDVARSLGRLTDAAESANAAELQTYAEEARETVTALRPREARFWKPEDVPSLVARLRDVESRLRTLVPDSADPALVQARNNVFDAIAKLRSTTASVTEDAAAVGERAEAVTTREVGGAATGTPTVEPHPAAPEVREPSQPAPARPEARNPAPAQPSTVASEPVSAGTKRLVDFLHDAGISREAAEAWPGNAFAKLSGNADTLAELEKVLPLVQNGKIQGMEDWLAFSGKKAPVDMARTVGELREAARLSAEYPDPDVVIHIGGDAKAPMRAGGPESLPSFDITVETKGGTVLRSVEVSSVDYPVWAGSQIKTGISHAASKVANRAEAGAAIEGQREATVQIALRDEFSQGRGGRIAISRDGSRVRITQASPPASMPMKNVFDELTEDMAKIPTYAEHLDRVNIVDATSGALRAQYDNVDGVWYRVRR